MKGRRMETILALLCMLSLPAWPRSQDKAGPAVNKQRVFFSELEAQWLKAAQEKDPAALNRIVSDEFHLWTSVPPGNPIPREEWFAGVFGRKVLASHLRQLAVRSLSPEIAIVSFVETETYQQTATPKTEDHFVIDIWINKGSGDNWRCTDRYVSEVKGAFSDK
jgi:Domain of unknown function (DUF4440)